MIAAAGQMLRIDMEGTGIDIPIGYLVQIQIKVAHCAAVEMQALRLRRKRSDMAIFQPGKVSRAERERIATESVEIGFHIFHISPQPLVPPQATAIPSLLNEPLSKCHSEDAVPAYPPESQR